VGKGCVTAKDPAIGIDKNRHSLGAAGKTGHKETLEKKRVWGGGEESKGGGGSARTESQSAIPSVLSRHGAGRHQAVVAGARGGKGWAPFAGKVAPTTDPREAAIAGRVVARPPPPGMASAGWEKASAGSDRARWPPRRKVDRPRPPGQPPPGGGAICKRLNLCEHGAPAPGSWTAGRGIARRSCVPHSGEPGTDSATGKSVFFYRFTYSWAQSGAGPGWPPARRRRRPLQSGVDPRQKSQIVYVDCIHSVYTVYMHCLYTVYCICCLKMRCAKKMKFPKKSPKSHPHRQAPLPQITSQEHGGREGGCAELKISAIGAVAPV